VTLTSDPDPSPSPSPHPNPNPTVALTLTLTLTLRSLTLTLTLTLTPTTDPEGAYNEEEEDVARVRLPPAYLRLAVGAAAFAVALHFNPPGAWLKPRPSLAHAALVATSSPPTPPPCHPAPWWARAVPLECQDLQPRWAPWLWRPTVSASAPRFTGRSVLIADAEEQGL